MKKTKKRNWYFDLIMCFSYLFAGWYLLVMGVESMPEFAKEHNEIVSLFYALGIIGISIIFTIKSLQIFSGGYDIKQIM